MAERLFPMMLLVVACGGGEPRANPPAGPDPWTAVPPEQLAADPGVDCPPAYVSSAPDDGWNGSFEVGEQTRSFVLLRPGPGHDGPRPMFLAFHGTSEDADDFVQRAELDRFAARGFVVVAPESNGNGTLWPVWDSSRAPGDDARPNPDLEFVDVLVRCVAAHLPIDRHRIYTGGHSAGGIMTNYVLQRRSELFAGGIPASGVFSLTSPAERVPLSPMLVLVTWGGPHDEWGGGAGGVDVPLINFVEEASLASQLYDAEPAVGQVNCRNDVGHEWLDGLNGWMIDLLLAHPKGLPGSGDDLVLPPVPRGSGATCTTEPFIHESALEVVCPAGTTSGCTELCQLTADCAVENGTVGPILRYQLQSMGFAGDHLARCGGCLDACASVATRTADAEVLSCFRTAQAAAACGPGIEGSLPLFDAVNGCCDGRTDSSVCEALCDVMETSSAASLFLPTCEALDGG